MAKKGTLQDFFTQPKATNITKALNKPAQKSQQKTSSTSKRSREELNRSDADLLDQLTNPPPVSQPDTPALGPRRKKLRTLLGDGEDKQTASYREVQSRFAWLESNHVRDRSGKQPTDPEYDARTVQVPSDVSKKLSESQKQYWSIKQNYRDVILFFKVGKFYELYEDDAQIGADALEWKMTITGVGHCRQVGCPESGIDEAVQRLTRMGYKVGRIEQVETAKEAKESRGPKATIRRELTRIHTPATNTGSIGVDAVHLMALHEHEELDTAASSTQLNRVQYGFAFLDAAAGRFYVGSATDDASRANLGALLTQIAPRELLTARGSMTKTTDRLLTSPPVPLQLSSVQPGSEFPDPSDIALATDKQALFGTLQLSDEMAHSDPAGLAALAALQQHLKRMLASQELASTAQLVVPYEVYTGALRLDGPTLHNLELLEGGEGGPDGSLLSQLDTCCSPGGQRLLRRWICRPLLSKTEINKRLDAVGELSARPGLVQPLCAMLRVMPDMERALGRLRNNAAPPALGLPDWAIQAAQKRRLSALATGVVAIEEAGQALSSMVKTIRESLEWPSTSTINKKGKGAKATAGPMPTLLDEVVRSRMLQENQEEDSPAAYLAAEVEATDSLIADFNAHANAYEAMEAALSSIDVLVAFATFSQTAAGPTCRPDIIDAGEDTGGKAVLDLRGVWHPCVNPAVGRSVVPNNLQLGKRDGSGPRALLLTGANMAGKSTISRATCIAVILAQVGCSVPAAACCLTLADRIFTRLGASDRIMTGESTFLVECAETASILQHATPDSLVVLDELGRGTSTFDGYAIAHAVLKHLSSQQDCRQLFATHYHPLTAEFANNPCVALGHMAAVVTQPSAGSQQQAASLIFLYQLRSGACPCSYGLQVAQLAGIPKSISESARRAGAVLENRLQGAFGKQGDRKALAIE
ncbi:hypothetical protein WJX84_008725 [Apatococcus fuscideae]|uniref:DNA mismatch repair proteins mutS family domain-containing protein n=1 Tax=Apatococcus fuscideae TaxID=2026836 RepID=A0AAW1SPV3_9CHLO